MSIEQTIIAADPPAHVCPRHPEVILTLLLRGGAGWCISCCCYQQSANHAEPTRDIPRPEPKQAKRKAKATTKRKPKAAAKASSQRSKKLMPAGIGAAREIN